MVGTSGEIAFDRELRLTLDGEPCRLTSEDGLWVATYPHTREGRVLAFQGAA